MGVLSNGILELEKREEGRDVCYLSERAKQGRAE
jgi:hypothetical protein